MLPALLALALVPAPAVPEPAPPPGAAEHAPAALIDLLVAPAQRWSVALQASATHAQGLIDGARKQTRAEVLAQGYTETPGALREQRQVLSLATSPSAGFTLRAALPLVEKALDARTAAGERFTLRAQGVGDLELGAGLAQEKCENERVAVGLTLRAPTGSVTARDERPGAPASKLEYPLQIGSGTWDLSPTLAWRLSSNSWIWGLDLEGTLHNGHNSEGWARGDSFSASGWAAYEWSPGLSGSVRLAAERWGNVRGADDELDPSATPAADAKKQSGERVDAALGLNWMPASGFLEGGLVGLELGAPLAQDLVGPQLAQDWFATLGVTLSF